MRNITHPIIPHRSWAHPLGLSVRRSFEDCISREDTLSLADIGLLSAFRRFDPARKTPFKVFARPWVRGAVHRAICNELRYRNHLRALPETLPMETYGNDRAESRVAMSQQLGRLAPHEQTLLIEHIALGLSIRNIAGRRKRSPSSVYRALQESFTRLREANGFPGEHS